MKYLIPSYAQQQLINEYGIRDVVKLTVTKDFGNYVEIDNAMPFFRDYLKDSEIPFIAVIHTKPVHYVCYGYHWQDTSYAIGNISTVAWVYGDLTNWFSIQTDIHYLNKLDKLL